MCNKADNSCREEKLGCQGCYYGKLNNSNMNLVLEVLEEAIVRDKISVIITKYKNNFIITLKCICMANFGKIQYIVRKDTIEVIQDNKIRVIIKEIK